jgi:hypothetical protein
MDLRTTLREPDEMIERSQIATEREEMLLDALPACGLRRRKQERVRTMRAHMRRLRSLRRTAKSRRRFN